MIRPILVAAVLVATATTASAGGFVGLGIGTGPGINSDLTPSYSKDGRTGRLELGYRFGRISVEGLAGRSTLIRIDGYHWDDTSLGLAGMYNLPLGDAFEAYGRLGYQHSTLSPTDSEREEYDGSGILVGAGFQFKLPVAVASVSLFVDYTITHSSLASPPVLGQMEEGFTTRVWTLGAKLGF